MSEDSIIRILLDLDSTTLSYEPNYENAIKTLLSHGILSPSSFYPIKPFTVIEFLREISQRLDHIKHKGREFINNLCRMIIKDELISTERATLRFDPGELVKRLKAKDMRILICGFSALSGIAVRKVLQKFALVSVFDHVYGRSMILRPPKLDDLLYTKQESPSSIINFVVTGDELILKEFKGFRGPNLKVIATPTHPTKIRNLIYGRPDYFVISLYELVDIIDLIR
ncbi:MAG: hypothetical protein QXW58_06650 [Thermosphaera sp.]